MGPCSLSDRILDLVLEPVFNVNDVPTPTSRDVQKFMPDVDISSVMGPDDDPDFPSG